MTDRERIAELEADRDRLREALVRARIDIWQLTGCAGGSPALDMIDDALTGSGEREHPDTDTERLDEFWQGIRSATGTLKETYIAEMKAELAEKQKYILHLEQNRDGKIRHPPNLFHDKTDDYESRLDGSSPTGAHEHPDTVLPKRGSELSK